MRHLRLDERLLVGPADEERHMPLDTAMAPAAPVDEEPKFFEPLLPEAQAEDWQGSLRLAFEPEMMLWRRRVPKPRLVFPRG